MASESRSIVTFTKLQEKNSGKNKKKKCGQVQIQLKEDVGGSIRYSWMETTHTLMAAKMHR